MWNLEKTPFPYQFFLMIVLLFLSIGCQTTMSIPDIQQHLIITAPGMDEEVLYEKALEWMSTKTADNHQARILHQDPRQKLITGNFYLILQEKGEEYFIENLMEIHVSSSTLHVMALPLKTIYGDQMVQVLPQQTSPHQMIVHSTNMNSHSSILPFLKEAYQNNIYLLVKQLQEALTEHTTES